MRAYLIAALAIAASFIFFTASARAHPMGNFSISHYSGIRIGKDAIEIKYILDLAEIPTFQELQENGVTARADDEGVQAYVRRKTEILRDGLRLQISGKPLRLEVGSTEIIFPPGAGGLPTMKVGIVFKANLSSASAVGEQLLTYRDENFPGRAGWKEIIVAVDRGVELISSSASMVDRSRELSDYPTDLLNSPPQQLEAQTTFLVRTVAPPVTAAKNVVSIGRPSAREIPPSQDPQPSTDVSLAKSSDSRSVQLTANQQATPRNAFTEMMAQKQLGWKIVLFAFAVAVGLGAFHALEPGHGKTLVAAYLVGSHGTFKHALLLGLVVTAAHTAGVYLLGLATLYASQYIVPERLYPWLGLTSGIMVMTLGTMLLLRRHRDKHGMHSHQHGHTRHHHHGSHDHEYHSHGDHHHEPKKNVSLKQLLALGVSGGIVPCPAALVVLLSAVSMQRIGLGLLLIGAFSVGLATVLVAVGMLMVYARRFMSHFRGEGRIITRWLPLASSAFILLIGVGLTWQALVSAGLIQL
jgi:ABC-type nickel/cobalt efflux system permease component RcnA